MLTLRVVVGKNGSYLYIRCISLSHILLVALVPSHKFSQSIGEYAHNPWRKYKSEKEAPKQPFMRSQECKEAERENQDH